MMSGARTPRPANDRLLRALAREPVDRVPVWLMRQAGRYLPEYQRVRERAGSFMALATDPQLAAEVTLQPLARFALDAAILFSDILTIPDAMGLGLSFAEGEGPYFARPVRDEAAIAALAVPDLAKLDYVFDAIAAIRRDLAGRVPLIGFAGSPFTLACYMVEGRSSAEFATLRRMVVARPDLVDRLVTLNADAIAGCLAEQARAGANVLMIFDSWGGLLDEASWRRFSLGPTRRVLAALPAGVPTLLFTRGRAGSLAALAASGISALGIDWTVDLAAARREVGAAVALQGNLDPIALTADPAHAVAAANAVLDAAGSAPGYVFNLGHGIVPTTPVESVLAVVEAVHARSVWSS
jgi:uroporphyrinogen decarboxylase